MGCKLALDGASATWLAGLRIAARVGGIFARATVLHACAFALPRMAFCRLHPGRLAKFLLGVAETSPEPVVPGRAKARPRNAIELVRRCGLIPFMEV